jgi:hypothetical protein
MKCIVGRMISTTLVQWPNRKLLSTALNHLAVDSFIEEQGFNDLGVMRIVFKWRMRV